MAGYSIQFQGDISGALQSLKRLESETKKISNIKINGSGIGKGFDSDLKKSEKSISNLEDSFHSLGNSIRSAFSKLGDTTGFGDTISNIMNSKGFGLPELIGSHGIHAYSSQAARKKELAELKKDYIIYKKNVTDWEDSVKAFKDKIKSGQAVPKADLVNIINRGHELKNHGITKANSQPKIEQGKGGSDLIPAGISKLIPGIVTPLTAVVGAVSAAIAAAVIAVTGYLKDMKEAVNEAASFETISVGLEGVLGSKEAAEGRMTELSAFAASTPFNLPEIAKASKVLETLTKGALSTGDGLTLVGDNAAKAGVSIDEMSVTIGRAYSNIQSGRAAGETLSRLQELGLLSGEVRNKLEDMQKNGESGSKVWSVLASELNSANGAMKKLSQTYTGLQSTLNDTEAEGKRTFGKEMLEGEKAGLKAKIANQTIFNSLLKDEESIQQRLRNATNRAVANEEWEVSASVLKGVWFEMKEGAGSVYEYLSKAAAKFTNGVLNMLTGMVDARKGLIEALNRQDQLAEEIANNKELQANWDSIMAVEDNNIPLAEYEKLINELKEAGKSISDNTFFDLFEKVVPDKKIFDLSFDEAFSELRKLEKNILELPDILPEDITSDGKSKIEDMLKLLPLLRKHLDDMSKSEKDKSSKLDFINNYDNELKTLELNKKIADLKKSGFSESAKLLEEEKLALEKKLFIEKEIKALKTNGMSADEAQIRADRKADLMDRFRLKDDNNANETKSVFQSLMEAVRNITTSSFGQTGNGFGGAPAINTAQSIARQMQLRQISIQEQLLKSTQTSENYLKTISQQNMQVGLA